MTIKSFRKRSVWLDAWHILTDITTACFRNMKFMSKNVSFHQFQEKYDYHTFNDQTNKDSSFLQQDTRVTFKGQF